MLSDDVEAGSKGFAAAATCELVPSAMSGGGVKATVLWNPNSERIAAMRAERSEFTP